MLSQDEADRRNLRIHKRLNLNLIDDLQKAVDKIKLQAKHIKYLNEKLTSAGITPERVKMKKL